MPELIVDGPEIPDSLLNDLDDGRVVFFCGAGVSMGPGSELPSFGCLARHVYRTNDVNLDPVEQGALDRQEFDKFFGLLERPEQLGVQQVRRSVSELLSGDPTGTLATHEALLKLSQVGQGFRLVTTNFDNRFVAAGADENRVTVAPQLPIPKAHDWSSIVHLHGRIHQADSDAGSNLVLTAADFGRAYLTERWAARFVTELFRAFTVVFVGYSLQDHVMGYLVDALAAETAKSGSYRQAYAFAAHDGTERGRESTETEWRAKNVTPIVYACCDGHRLLTKTLEAWAEIKSDPFRSRERIVLDGMCEFPNPFDAGRVTWALQDPTTAEKLAGAPPLADPVDYPKLEQWLDKFDGAGLFGRPALDSGDSSVSLVSSNQTPTSLDAATWHMARWMAGHLHVPQLLTWVLKKGGALHPVLRDQIRSSLARPPTKVTKVPPRLRHLWAILAEESPPDQNRFFYTLEHLKVASDDERQRIAEHAVASIAPRLAVRPGPARFIVPPLESPVDSCAHLELVLGYDHVPDPIQRVLEYRSVLSRFAHTLTGYLEDAASLMNQIDGPDWSLGIRHPISGRSRNRVFKEWEYLVDLVRDSYFAVAEGDATKARNLLDRWMLSDHRIFMRLALHALTDDGNCDIRLAKPLLLGEAAGIWDREMLREVRRFFRKAGARLPVRLQKKIVRAIRAGSKASDQEKSILLYQLAFSGVTLNKKSKALADQWQPSPEESVDERDEVPNRINGGGWVGPEEFAPADLLDGGTEKVVVAVRTKTIDPSEFGGLAIERPEKAIGALPELFQVSPEYWHHFLVAVFHLRGRGKLPMATQDQVADLLMEAPDQLSAGIGLAASGFVADLAKAYGRDQECRFRRLWSKVWGGVGKGDETRAPLDAALNTVAGRLARAAVERMSKYDLRAGQGLPDVVRPYFDTIVSHPHAWPGRVILARHLCWLHAVDPNWTEQQIISRMAPAESKEALALWSGYAWSPTINPNLFTAFKSQFLSMLEEYDGVQDAMLVLMELLVKVCLDYPDALEMQEVRQAVGSLSACALEGVLEYLSTRLTGTMEERAQIWRGKLEPWLEEYWPREGDRNTARTADAMLKLILECGSSFPEAVCWSLERGTVQPSEHLESLIQLSESTNYYIASHPDSVLKILNGIVGPEPMRPDDRPRLQLILKSLKTVNPHVAKRPIFQDLQRRASQ